MFDQTKRTCIKEFDFFLEVISFPMQFTSPNPDLRVLEAYNFLTKLEYFKTVQISRLGSIRAQKVCQMRPMNLASLNIQVIFKKTCSNYFLFKNNDSNKNNKTKTIWPISLGSENG